MCPVVGPSWPPVPVSIRTSFEPVLTSSAVNEVGTMPGGRNASLSALFTSAGPALRTNVVVDLAEPGAVVDGGDLEAAELLAVDARALHAGGRRRGYRGRGCQRSRCGRAGEPMAAADVLHAILPRS